LSDVKAAPQNCPDAAASTVSSRSNIVGDRQSPAAIFALNLRSRTAATRKDTTADMAGRRRLAGERDHLPPLTAGASIATTMQLFEAITGPISSRITALQLPGGRLHAITTIIQGFGRRHRHSRPWATCSDLIPSKLDTVTSLFDQRNKASGVSWQWRSPRGCDSMSIISPRCYIKSERSRLARRGGAQRFRTNTAAANAALQPQPSRQTPPLAYTAEIVRHAQQPVCPRHTWPRVRAVTATANYNHAGAGVNGWRPWDVGRRRHTRGSFCRRAEQIW
jgi:hypothetical protein